MFGDAEAYQRFMGRWSRTMAPLLVDFADIPDGGRVLDIGCGTGSLSFSIAESKARCRVSGIDRSKEYIAYAESRNPFPGRVSFQAADAQRTEYPDASFQASLSLLVFNFIPEPGKALEEARRLTAAGGRIAAATWDYGDRMQMLRIFWQAAAHIDGAAAEKDEKHMRLCSAGELTALWTQAGLEQVDEQPLEIRMRFASFEDYWNPFLLGQGPAGAYLRGLAADRLEKLRAEVKRRLEVASEDQPFALPARAWAVRGTVPAG
jgi:SAM-dependent methyltransferase